MRPASIVLVPIMSFVTTALAMIWIRRWLLRARIIDGPRGPLSDSPVTPRGGGFGILAGLLAGLAATGWLDLSPARLGVLAGILLMGAVGWVDDLGIRLPVPLRLGAQMAAAFTVVWLQGGVHTWPLPAPWDGPAFGLGGPVAVLWIVAVINFYNFMDGIDGLAGMQALLAGLVLSALATAGPFLGPGLALSGASAGFLVHNWHPARVIMGDVGSQATGFFIASLPLLAPPRRRGEVLFIVAMALSLCLADGTYTLLRRFLRGERIWEGHREHLYQRLIRTGQRPDQVSLWIAAAALPASFVGVLGFRMGRAQLEWTALGIALVIFVAHLVRTLVREQSCVAAGDWK